MKKCMLVSPILNFVKVYWVSGILLLFLAPACKKNADIITTHKLELSSDTTAAYISKRLIYGGNWGCDFDLALIDSLKLYYQENNFKPFWWDILSNHPNSIKELNTLFMVAVAHGLSEKNYHPEIFPLLVRDLQSAPNQKDAYEFMADLDVLLSHQVILLAKEIAVGKLDPIQVIGGTYMLPRNMLKHNYLSEVLHSSQKISLMNGYHSNDSVYLELQALLKYFRIKQSKETELSIDFGDLKKIKPGDSLPVIREVISKLKQNNWPDSSIFTIPDTPVYIDKLIPKIKQIQEMHQLSPDGVMGFKTFQIINQSADYKIMQIRANLERQRWFSKPSKKRFVYVNIPEYRAYIYYEDSIKSMKTCVGKSLPDKYDDLVREYTDSNTLWKLPKNMETPQAYGKISVIVLNPTWTVPRSIVQNEMYWRMRNDPYYLERNNYLVYYKDKLVRSDTINWARYNAKYVPYKFVQAAGRDNALGKVKFLFYNPFDVYLHDTPSKSAFNLTQRAVSHGCVRLEDPILFGEFIIQNSSKYNPDDFRIMMGLKPKDKDRLQRILEGDTTEIKAFSHTKMIRIEQPIPVYFDYRTIYFNTNWKAQFAYDIYDKNKRIATALDQL